MKSITLWSLLSMLFFMACTTTTDYEYVRDTSAATKSYDSGQTAIKEGHHNIAIYHFEKAIVEFKSAYRNGQSQRNRAINQNIGRCYVHIAFAYYQIKQYAEALKAIDAAFEIPALEENFRSLAYAVRGLAYYDMGDYWGAKLAHKNGVALRIDSPLLDYLQKKLSKW